MLLEFEVERSTRRCAATDRALQPGEACFSVVEVQGAEIVRKDYCVDSWSGPPENALGWWKSRVPEPAARKIKLAPNDVLLELFDELAERLDQADLRYVLTLLLIRRRVLRLEESAACQPSNATPGAQYPAPDNHDRMHVYCPKREATYEVLVDIPTGERVDEIQKQLSDLLIAGAD